MKHGPGLNTTKKWLVIQVGNWLLYIGIFLCCTGVGVVPGAILIFVWGITQITSKEQTNTTINNYNFESEKFQQQLESDIQYLESNTSTDSDTIAMKEAEEQYRKSQQEYNHKKGDYSDETREKMK